MEASLTAKNLMLQGKSVDEARQAAGISFALNLALNKFTNKAFFDEIGGEPTVRGVMRSVVKEPFQEEGQNEISNVLEGRPIGEGAIESLAGGLAGGIIETIPGGRSVAWRRSRSRRQQLQARSGQVPHQEHRDCHRDRESPPPAAVVPPPGPPAEDLESLPPPPPGMVRPTGDIVVGPPPPPIPSWNAGGLLPAVPPVTPTPAATVLEQMAPRVEQQPIPSWNAGGLLPAVPTVEQRPAVIPVTPPAKRRGGRPPRPIQLPEQQWAGILGRARDDGYTGTEAQLREAYNEVRGRAESMKEMVETGGASDRQLLQMAAKHGGVRVPRTKGDSWAKGEWIAGEEAELADYSTAVVPTKETKKGGRSKLHFLPSRTYCGGQERHQQRERCRSGHAA